MRMLRITIPSIELWDENKEEFIYTKEQTLDMEHSLVSISKWESKWHTPFFAKREKTTEEILYYAKCMTITQNVDPKVYLYLSTENLKQIDEYINDSMTATTFSENNNKKNGGNITSEIIYYWMITLNIPFECQKWHLNRLMTLIKVCDIKNKPPKKRSKRDIMSRNAALNAARRKQLNSKG